MLHKISCKPQHYRRRLHLSCILLANIEQCGPTTRADFGIQTLNATLAIDLDLCIAYQKS